MSGWESDILDEFLREAADAETDRSPEESPSLAALEAFLRPAPQGPSSSARQSLLDSLELEGRFDRFIDSVAALLFVEGAQAKDLLDGIGRNDNWVPSPLPHVTLYHIDGGPEVADAVTGFVRIPAGETFPEHRHCGHESVLVLQGSLLDLTSGEIFHPGEIAEQVEGSSHSFVVRDGPDLVYLVVAQQGVMLGDQHIAPDSPDF